MLVFKIRPCLLLLTLISLPVSVWSATPTLDQQITALLDQTLPQATLGMAVVDPQTNTLLYARREHEPFYPASNTKLLTASAALQTLGPDFKYETRLQTAPNAVQGNVLQGDLAVTFTGDPSFTSADLRALLKTLQTQKVTQIHGDILIDDTAFKGAYYGPGWTHDSIVWGYSAPVSAIIIDENKLSLSLDKPKNLHDLIPIRKQRPDHPAQLTAKVTAVTREEAKDHCQIQPHTKNNHIVLKGCYAHADTPTVLELAIDSPRQLAKAYIEKALAADNITLVGTIRFAPTPSNFQPIATKTSAPLSALLIPILSDSNNIYAESLTKTLGRYETGHGTFQSGTLAIKNQLHNNELFPKTPFRLSDGSGQSRYNLISPFMLSQLLLAMKQDPNFEIYKNALSVGGVKGTLATRMQDPTLKGKVFAKTGGATGTSTLSGYLIADNGKPYIFSIMINQIALENGGYQRVKAFEDQLCQLLLKALT